MVESVAAALVSQSLSISCGPMRGVTKLTVRATPRIGPNEIESDWLTTAAAADSTILYMAAGQAPQIASALIGAGKSAGTPVAIVENASLDNEQRIFTTLAGLTASSLSLAGPAVLCVGEVFAAPVASVSIASGHESRPRDVHASRCQVG